MPTPNPPCRAAGTSATPWTVIMTTRALDALGKPQSGFWGSLSGDQNGCLTHGLAKDRPILRSTRNEAIEHWADSAATSGWTIVAAVEFQSPELNCSPFVTAAPSEEQDHRGRQSKLSPEVHHLRVLEGGAIYEQQPLTASRTRTRDGWTDERGLGRENGAGGDPSWFIGDMGFWQDMSKTLELTRGSLMLKKAGRPGCRSD
ncbi:hypothetical protein B0O80DRAFT_433897 [Mortierella sp. GBAus27b]|nr:hypothetical protein B0O80DRAFT_433897 [Mortierella sp. GBAus27b]